MVCGNDMVIKYVPANKKIQSSLKQSVHSDHAVDGRMSVWVEEGGEIVCSFRSFAVAWGRWQMLLMK